MVSFNRTARYVPRPSPLSANLRALDERIERTLATGNHNGLRRRLYVELLRVLNGSGSFSLIPEIIPGATGLTDRIRRRLANGRNYALARAIYESRNYGISPEKLMARRELHRSEWHYLTELSTALRLPPHYGHETISRPPPWMIDVDESHQRLRVWIRELALQDMLLAAMEAFLVPAGSGIPSTEVYGIIFGSSRGDRGNGRNSPPSVVELNVERVCIQHRARCGPSEIFVDQRSEATQLAMGEELFPYWTLMGDFHTHTYRSLSDLYRQGGWQYSNTDEVMNMEWCERLRQIGHRPRLALILAITRAGRSGGVSQEAWKGMSNVVRATIRKCHCFIAAYRVRPDGRYSTEGLSLKCPHLVGQNV